MTEELKTFRYHRNGLVFSWAGGAYIEIYLEGNAMPYDVYNVWDYEKDVPTIERSMAGLVAFIDEQFEIEEEEWGRLS
jgi:uncharacterized protein (DUF427 family)